MIPKESLRAMMKAIMTQPNAIDEIIAFIEQSNIDIKEFSDKLNTLRCKAVVRKMLKESVDQNYYAPEILNSKDTVSILANDYYRNCRERLFDSEYHNSNDYCAFAYEQAKDENAEMLKKFYK